jgi:hypothetical protein
MVGGIGIMALFDLVIVVGGGIRGVDYPGVGL